MQQPTRLIDPQDNLAAMRAELEQRRTSGVWEECAWQQSSGREKGQWSVTETLRLYFRKTVDPTVGNKSALDMVGVTTCVSGYAPELRPSTAYRVVVPIGGLLDASFVVTLRFTGEPTFTPDEIYLAVREMLRAEMGLLSPGQPTPEIQWEEFDKGYVDVVPQIYEMQPGALLRCRSGRDFIFTDDKARDKYADGRSFAHATYVFQPDVQTIAAKYPSLAFTTPPYFGSRSGVTLADKKTVFRKRLRLAGSRTDLRRIPKVGGPIFSRSMNIDELTVVTYPKKLGSRFEPDKWVMARRWFDALAWTRKHHVRLIAPGILMVGLVVVRCSMHWDHFHSRLSTNITSYADIVRILPWAKDKQHGP